MTKKRISYITFALEECIKCGAYRQTHPWKQCKDFISGKREDEKVCPASCPKCGNPFKPTFDKILKDYNQHVLKPTCLHYPKDVLISIG